MPETKPNYRRAANKLANREKVSPYDYPIKPPQIIPGVVPEGKTAPVVAMDASFYDLASQTFPGGGFPGFQALAQLATRAEYRAFASTLSTELTREWIEFTSADDDDTATSEKIKQLEEEFRRLNVRGIFQKAAEHDCLYGRGQIFIDIDGAKRDKPLIIDPRTIKQGSLKRLSAVEAVWTTPAAFNALDPAAPDFYRPPSWFMLGQHVHSTRLLTVVTRELPDILKPAFNFAGMSLSQLTQPYVDNWLRTRQSVADLINNFSITVLATAMDQVLQGDEGSDLLARADLFTAMRSNKGLMLLDKEREELVQVNTPLSGLHELQSQAQEHMCLSKGTLIRVLRGWIPIEDVTVHDKILTRNGYAPVEWAGITGLATKLVEIKTESSTLLATEDHPIWSASKNDFVSAKNVDSSHILRKNKGWGSTESQSLGEVGCGAARKQATTEIPRRAASCIAYCGKRMLAQFHRAWMFTTKMAMALTTGSKISKFFLGQSISPSMSQEGGGLSLGNRFACLALTASKTLRQRCRTEQYIAPTDAESQHIDCEEKVKTVRNVLLNEPTLVYNIKVADGFLPEFYANGMLVHNCSISRLPAIILTGISPSGLNASSDGEIRVFYDWIAAQQEAFWRHPLEIVMKVAQMSLFGEIDPRIGFKFVSLHQMTPEQEASIRTQNATNAVAYINAGVIDPSEERERLARDPNSGYQGLDTTLEIVPPNDPGDVIPGEEGNNAEEAENR